MPFRRCIVAIFLYAALGFGQTEQPADTGLIELSGNLSGRLARAGSPYVVTDTITIPIGIELIIEKGTVLLFRNFTGLVVNGKLRAEGTAKDPIIFTSENDLTVNPLAAMEPAPFDWDGITLCDTSGLSTLRHCAVRYSLFGVACKSDNVILDSLTFKANGQSDIVRQTVPVTAPSGPFSFTGLGVQALPEPVVGKLFPASASAPIEEPKPVRPPRQPRVRTEHSKVPARVITGLLFAAGAIVTGAEAGQFSNAKAHFNTVNTFDASARAHYTSADWDAAQNDLNQKRAGLLAGVGCALIGALGLTFTFVF